MWSQNFCKFLALSLEFQKFFSITRTIFPHSRSEQFLKQITFCGCMDYGVGVVGSLFFKLFLWKVCGGKDLGVDVVGSVFIILCFGHPFVLLGIWTGYHSRSLPGNGFTIEVKVFSCKNKYAKYNRKDCGGCKLIV